MPVREPAEPSAPTRITVVIEVAPFSPPANAGAVCVVADGSAEGEPAEATTRTDLALIAEMMAAQAGASVLPGMLSMTS